jgi:diguanylate cyclase (GGDEF)-like protein
MRVLIADDDAVHLRQMESLLAKMGYEVLKAADGAQALKALEGSDPIPLVVADWMMPQMDGLQLCREIRKRYADRFIHVILLTMRDRSDDVVAGLEAGADDYLVKPVNHGELSARLRAAQRLIELQGKLLEAHERLRVLATHDELTGILNRRAILDTMAREIDRSERQGQPMAALLIDLDYFKRVNDTHGHLAGDDVLREAAHRIAATVRSYDTVGRYGGEEFLVVTSNLDSGGALELAERVRTQFKKDPITTGGKSLPVTLSVGVATLGGGQKAEINKLLALADDCLYKAKRSGRDLTVMEAL